MMNAMRTIRYGRFTAAIAFVVLLLSSCVDIESRISLEENGSGEVTLAYEVSRMMASLEAVPGNGVLPLPIEESDFRAGVSRIPGLSLLSYSRSDDEDTVRIDARIEFASLDALNGFYAPAGSRTESIRVESSDAGGRWVQVLYPGTGEPVDPESRDFLQTFFSEYDLSMTFEAPAPVREVNRGEFDGDTATLSIPISEIVANPGPVVWEVSWR